MGERMKEWKDDKICWSDNEWMNEWMNMPGVDEKIRCKQDYDK